MPRTKNAAPELEKNIAIPGLSKEAQDALDLALAEAQGAVKGTEKGLPKAKAKASASPKAKAKASVKPKAKANAKAKSKANAHQIHVHGVMLCARVNNYSFAVGNLTP